MKCVCSQQKEIKMKRKIIIFLIFVFVSNVSFAHDVQTDEININHPHIKFMDNSNMAYGYMKIVNKSNEVDRLTGIEVSFADAELFDAHMHDGNSPMKKIDYIEIPPQKVITLELDSYHIMFSNMNIEVVEDMMLEATLSFEKSGDVNIEFISEKDKNAHDSH